MGTKTTDLNLISRKQASEYIIKELKETKIIIVLSLIITILSVVSQTMFVKFALVMPLMAYLGIKFNQKMKYKEHLEEKYGLKPDELDNNKQ